MVEECPLLDGFHLLGFALSLRTCGLGALDEVLKAHGVDMEPAIKVLAGGLAGNAILDRKAASMLARSFDPGFRIDLHHKDLGIVQAAAREAGVVIPVGALVSQLVASLRAQGHDSLDHSALLLLEEQLSGRSSG